MRSEYFPDPIDESLDSSNATFENYYKICASGENSHITFLQWNQI